MEDFYRDLGHTSHKERMRKLGVFILLKRSLQAWPIARGTKVVDKLSSSLANDKRQYCQVASWEIHVGHQEKKFA